MKRRALHKAERKYLFDAAFGLTAKESAELHTVSVNTVNTTLKRATLALGAVNITHAVTLAYYGEFTPRDVLTRTLSSNDKEQQS